METAYLVVICDKETNAIQDVKIWAATPWQKLWQHENDLVLVAWCEEGNTFEQAKCTLIRESKKRPEVWALVSKYIVGRQQCGIGYKRLRDAARALLNARGDMKYLLGELQSALDAVEGDSQ